MKMVDIGEKSESGACCSPEVATKSNKKIYPCLWLRVVPDALWGKEVGTEGEAKIKFRIKNKSLNQNDTKENKTMDIEVLSIGVEGKAKEVEDLSTEMSRQLGDD